MNWMDGMDGMAYFIYCNYCADIFLMLEATPTELCGGSGERR